MTDRDHAKGLALLDIPPAARPAWQALRRAVQSHTPACTADPEGFHHLRAAAARAICAACPIAEPCATYATVAGELGVWGGTTEQDRRNRTRK